VFAADHIKQKNFQNYSGMRLKICLRHPREPSIRLKVSRKKQRPLCQPKHVHPAEPFPPSQNPSKKTENAILLGQNPIFRPRMQKKPLLDRVAFLDGIEVSREKSAVPIIF
jgi:hypothetical protein